MSPSLPIQPGWALKISRRPPCADLSPSVACRPPCRLLDLPTSPMAHLHGPVHTHTHTCAHASPHTSEWFYFSEGPCVIQPPTVYPQLSHHSDPVKSVRTCSSAAHTLQWIPISVRVSRACRSLRDLYLSVQPALPTPLCCHHTPYCSPRPSVSAFTLPD